VLDLKTNKSVFECFVGVCYRICLYGAFAGRLVIVDTVVVLAQRSSSRIMRTTYSCWCPGPCRRQYSISMCETLHPPASIVHAALQSPIHSLRDTSPMPFSTSPLLHLHSVPPSREMCTLLLLLLSNALRILLTQASPDCTGVFRSQVERQVLLLGVEQAQLVALVGVDHGEHAGDGFAEIVAITSWSAQRSRS
jgi:hypothetical protein